MQPSVYVETSVISYLVGWLNRNDLQVAAHQEVTRRWWATRRTEFALFASAVVLDEAADGDPALAAERLRFLQEIALLLPLVYEVCRAAGYEPPLVCTPFELLGESYEL
ncbi:MAG TPA: hypothetical protein VE974_03770 [Thermoanaerobaculia bacterium]|nr:hypothetical protein [Thermoanaerobaculia bacterium]